MNIYTTEFFAKCPANDIRIRYRLEIKTVAPDMIMVENILAEVDKIKEGYHEDIADKLVTLGGEQTITADHHGVTIETRRKG